jgi:ATP-dependent Clp protease ATP-binding subunit ClpB
MIIKNKSRASNMRKHTRTELNPLLKCEDTNDFFNKLKAKVIGQDEALEKIADIIQTYKAGLHQKGKPLSNVIFLGSSGTGKTRSVESVASALFGDEKAFFKMNCGEFQSSSSIATLIGAAPGYIGYKQTEPFISQDKIDKFQTKEFPINLILLDEIEKAHDAIFQLLLGILDKATLNMNNGGHIDFSSCIIFMTSNLGSESIVNADKEGLGFATNTDKRLDSQIKKAALGALEKKFSPEFVNRLDHTVVFNTLTEDSVRKILDLEMLAVRGRIFTSKPHIKFTFIYTKKVEDFILQQGFSRKFGARELKRTISRHVTNPLASLMMSRQLDYGDIVIISMRGKELFYEKIDSIDIYNYTESEWKQFKHEMINLEEPIHWEEALELPEQANDGLVARTETSM